MSRDASFQSAEFTGLNSGEVLVVLLLVESLVILSLSLTPPVSSISQLHLTLPFFVSPLNPPAVLSLSASAQCAAQMFTCFPHRGSETREQRTGVLWTDSGHACGR